jgi:Zn-dependent protease with chaperone function
MLRINGFYGHVRRNDLLSVATFAGFIVALQIIAAPVLALPLFFLDIGHSPLFPKAYASRYALPILLAGTGLFALRFFRHVASVRATIAFADVDRRTNLRLVNIVETAAIAAGLPLPKVGILETPARNAFACGISASSAVVVVTRGLLDTLDDDELAAVVAHEIAHIRNGDIRLMAAANVFMDILLGLQRRNFLRISNWRRAIVAVIFPPYLILAFLAGLVTRAGLTVARVSRLLISSSREFVADADAVRLTQKPEALISALRRIEGRSAVPGLSPQADAMMIDGAVEGHYASHPTIAERIAILARLSGVRDGLHHPTRSIPASNAPWGASSAVPTPTGRPSLSSHAAAPRSLLARVNVGPKEHPLGISPGAKWVLLIGFGLLATMQVATVLGTLSSSKREAPSRASAKPIEASGLSTMTAGTFSATSGRPSLRQEVERLSSLSPAVARCFSTKYYGVGDRGLHKFQRPDAELVQAHARDPGRGSSDVTPERYFGFRHRSIEAVERAGASTADEALLDYVRTRKIVLEVMHRFFGEEGLQAARETYGSAADHRIVQALRERLQDGLELGPEKARLRSELNFLVSASEDFIPCVARARLSTATSSSG